MAITVNLLQAGQQAATRSAQLRDLFRTLQPTLIGMGITFAAAAASMVLIPDSAVMTKQEIDEGTELSKSELMLRKIAATMIVGSVKDAAHSIVNLNRLFSTPGVESKVRATAALLAASPSFYVAYKALKRRFVDKEEPTLNAREMFSPKEMRNMALVSMLGRGLDNATTGVMLARAHEQQLGNL